MPSKNRVKKQKPEIKKKQLEKETFVKRVKEGRYSEKGSKAVSITYGRVDAQAQPYNAIMTTIYYGVR